MSTSNRDHDGLEVLLYGLGAIGSFYAFILQKSSHVRLSVVARSNYDAVKSNGLLMKSDNHGEHLFHPAATYRTCAEAKGRTFDYVVCCNKATDLNRSVKDLESVVQEGKTTIVLMQNGVGNEDPFHARWPTNTILSGVVWVGATQDSPGVVRQHLSESTTIGIFSNTKIPMTKQQAALDTFTSLFTYGQSPFIVDESIQTSRWKKCIWNTAWNSLTTLSTVEVHTWLDSSPYAMDSTRRLMGEAIQVAKAIGVPGIEDGLVEELIARMNGLAGPVWTSMYHDSRAGRAMEVDVILGTIVRKGREHGVSVPTLEILYALLLAMDQRLEKVRNRVEDGDVSR